MEPEILIPEILVEDLIGEKVEDEEEVTEPFSREEIKETVSRIETALTQPPARLPRGKRKTLVDINSYGTCMDCSFVYRRMAKDLRKRSSEGETVVLTTAERRSEEMYTAKLMKAMLVGVESLISIRKAIDGDKDAGKVVNNLGIGFVIDGKRI